MMNRTKNILLLIFLMVSGVSLWAQQKAKAKPAASKSERAGGKHIVRPGVYLGNSDFSGGPIQRNTLDEMLKHGFTSHDSMGNKYQVVGFDFTYAERSLYEDSVGNLETLMDYSYEYCPGDTLTSNITSSIYHRIKPGDTLYIDHVKLYKYDNPTTVGTDEFAGKSMKITVIK